MEGLELSVARREAERALGAKLAKVHEVGDVFFLRFFGPSLSLALDVGGKAFHLTALRPPAPQQPPPFCRKLRRLRGQPLLAIDQAGYDRLLRLRFPGGEIVLDCRPRQGDLFLLGEGEVASLRGGEWRPPDFSQPQSPVEGLGPSLRRAVAAQLGHEPNREELEDFAQRLLETPVRGYLYQTESGPRASFFPRPDWGEPVQQFPHFWQVLDRELAWRLSLEEARRYLAGVARAIRRRRRALAALARERQEAASWQDLKEKADLILTRLSQIPKGAGEAVVPGFDGAPVKLTLDPGLPPAHYAQALYRRAGKLRRKLPQLARREQTLREELGRLEEIKGQLGEKPELAPYLAGELASLGALPTPARRTAPAKPQPRALVVEGFRVVIGRSALENDELIRQANPRDLWFHARGVPGAHVVVRSGGRSVPPSVLKRAAELAAWYSQARGEPKVEVSYTEVRYLRKPRGAPPRTVVLRREQVLVVSGEAGP
jgi:predicted ribosome quality control (RQC) complex YloA/Tae2 family protein